MALTHRLRFGIKTSPQHTNYPGMLAVWREADALPVFEHAWLFDHFMPITGDSTGPCLEGWTTLAALATQTERLRVGVMVTGNTYRHPAILANMAATVDQISHGRLDFGIGAGWNEMEHSAYGIPLYATGERIRRLGEACEVVRRMWTEEAPDFDGTYYQLKGARCEPKPVQKPYPPFVIGGGGEQLTLRMVARYADIWNHVGGPVDVFTHKCAVLDQHCAAIGRDPSTIERSVQVLFDPNDPDKARAALDDYIAAGATHLVITFRPPHTAGLAAQAAEHVAAPLLAKYASEAQ